MAAKLEMVVDVDEDQSKLPTIYRLPKLYKRPYKSRVLLLILVHVQLATYLFL